MRKLFTIILIFYYGLNCCAQNNLPPVYEIVTDTGYQQNLNYTYWQILEDKGEAWTIEEVSKPPLSDKFIDSINKLKSSDLTARAYWFRYRLKNVMSREAKIALDSHSEQDDFYVLKTGGAWTHLVTGRLYPWNKKDGLKAGNYIPVTLEPQEELWVYNRTYNSNPRIARLFPLDFVSTDKEIEKELNSDNYFSMTQVLEGFMVGLLLISFFFNLFFYSIVREKVYLYFALFLFFLCINRLYDISYLYTARVYPTFTMYVPYLGYAWAFILFFLIQFIRHFFRTFATYKKWDKVLIGSGVLWILTEAIRFYLRIFSIPRIPILFFISGLLLIVIPFFLLVTLMLFIRTSDLYRRLVIAGAFPLMFFYGILGVFVRKTGGVFFYWQPLTKWIGINFRILELVCILWLVVLFSLVLFLRYNQLRKQNAQQALDNERLEKEKEIERNRLIAQQKIDLEKQVTERTAELKQSLYELKATQAQLIQSEKMASLGELTAGIAHEIQNPLNFINNFSEVNTELIDELKSEKLKVKTERDETLEKELLNDIAQNLEKINHHGKRADAIVKGMLQHSQSSKGKKEATDINALCDEYLRLSYHGLRAKDKSFNATIKTDFDTSIGKINIIPQDIGRVILNLINNAFYAVDEKKKTAAGNYEPTVSISTKKINDNVEIKVADNGNGIPQNIIYKIYQPFFTTKPTGQGTGLGLSLSYDIIKAHGGEIKLETKQSEGTEFKILLLAATF
jgi:two-component system NtrC family sensor kinase